MKLLIAACVKVQRLISQKWWKQKNLLQKLNPYNQETATVMQVD